MKLKFQTYGFPLVLVSLTLSAAAPPSPPPDAPRPGLVARLGLTMSAKTVTQVTNSRYQKLALNSRGSSSTQTPFVVQATNYWARPDRSGGEVRSYILIPILGRIQNNRGHLNYPPNVLIPLTRDGKPLTHKELANLYTNRGIFQDIANNITQFFPILPIEINVPDLFNTVTTWIYSIPFVNRWQQAQVNNTRIYATPSLFYLTPKNTKIVPNQGFRDSSSQFRQNLPVETVQSNDAIYGNEISSSNYFRILNEHFRVYKEQQQKRQT